MSINNSPHLTHSFAVFVVFAYENYCKEINSALFENFSLQNNTKKKYKIFCLIYKFTAQSLWSKSVLCSDFLKVKTLIVLKKVLQRNYYT